MSEGEARPPAVFAFLAILGTQFVFWGFTFPVNQLTSDWTAPPDDWERLRDRWEISHAVSALLNFTALVRWVDPAAADKLAADVGMQVGAH